MPAETPVQPPVAGPVREPVRTPGSNPWLTAHEDGPDALGPGSLGPDALGPDAHSVDDRSFEPGMPYAFTGVAPPVGALPDARLVRLAADLGEPVALVWSRSRRGECFEALLHPDGSIELPDGSRHTDPDTAAAAASCASAPVDGWRVWRIDSSWGLTLEEACGH